MIRDHLTLSILALFGLLTPPVVFLVGPWLARIDRAYPYWKSNEAEASSIPRSAPTSSTTKG